jgi:hypothetical protein
MILMVGLYEDAAPSRMAEFVECLRLNGANPIIERVVCFIESAATPDEVQGRWPVLANPKIEWIRHGQRVTYAFLIDHANRHFKDAVVGIANADIHFDDTLMLLDEVPLRGQMLCLSRWEVDEKGAPQHFDRPDSQDAWIFQAPVTGVNCAFSLGLPGCENRLAYEAERAGLTLSNPSRSIRAHHLHRSRVRRYTDKDRMHGPIRMVPTSFLLVDGLDAASHGCEDFPSHRTRSANAAVADRLVELAALLKPHVGGRLPHALRAELRRALVAQALTRPPADLPFATAVVRESMGYGLSRVASGISTHINDSRPLVTWPKQLGGLMFTQVVANRSDSVELRFTERGKLFVLVSPGWEGYEPAARFLNQAGWKQPIEPLRAADGTVFEPWLLVAEAGERLVIPTQVMVASEALQLG